MATQIDKSAAAASLRSPADQIREIAAALRDGRKDHARALIDETKKQLERMSGQSAETDLRRQLDVRS